MAKVRWLAFAGLAATLAIAAAWFAWREPDYTRVPVRSLQDLEQQLESLRTELGIPGMSAAIAEGDRVIWARGFGTANRERGVAAGPDTIYGLASLTKPYASTLVLQLVQEGRLSLDDDVARFGVVMERSRPNRAESGRPASVLVAGRLRRGHARRRRTVSCRVPGIRRRSQVD